MPGPSGSKGERPVTAMDARECAGYIAQLKSVLNAAAAQPPPLGVDTSEVERRMTLIQATLQRVEARAEDIRREQEEKELLRYTLTQQRRASLEEERDSRVTAQAKQKDLLLKEMHEMQVAYFKDHNNHKDEKALKCKEHKFKVHVATVSKAASTEQRRNENLSKLMTQREQHRQEMRDRELQRQQSAREVNRRRTKQIDNERAEKERQAERHAQQIETKLIAIRESRQLQSRAKHQANRARAAVVFENGSARLETVARDHEQLLQDLEDKVRGQQARYAEEKADRDLYLAQRARFRAMRYEQQQRRLISNIDSRLKRGDAILVESKVKEEKGDQAKEAQATQWVQAGKELRKDILTHLRRARHIEEQRMENTLNKSYRSWNHRAARIMADLQSAADAERQVINSASHDFTASDSRGRYSPLDETPNPLSNITPMLVAAPEDFRVE